MKNLSIRLKITLWFAAALILMVALSFVSVFLASNRVFQKTIQDNLIEVVESNIDEIRYFESADSAAAAVGMEYYLLYNGNYLGIDDDYLDSVNEVYTALYSEDGTFIYGENPVARQTAELAFTDSVMQKIRVNGTLYYVFDRELTADGLEGLWLRGVVSEEQGSAQISSIFLVTLIALPALLVVAVVGGYMIAGHILMPLRELSAAVSRIGDGEDLKARIDIGSGQDEVHELANQFNGMFERLEESFETERQFTSNASHELRTPMTVILAQCEYSLEEPRTEEEYVHALTVIERQGRKMSKLIRDMLDFSRLKLRTDYYMKVPVNLGHLVASICEDMAILREKNIELTFDAEEGILISGNETLLTRLLGNLIGNAYRYGREDGHIYVACRICREESGDTGVNVKSENEFSLHGVYVPKENELRKDKNCAILTVADDGIGIAPEEQKKIFRRFYQVDTARADDGTGLGLAMAWEIAQYHDGTIFVESEAGVGSCFTVVLPVVKE
ncbi:MAG: HAMP domain-containing histidine kinase [Lachnospiraceae bacterium]|nr:HAMP domain-containing histidine kinase [Lachnospiraceae bacterium]